MDTIDYLFSVIRLLRPEQWYKNLLVIVPLAFVGELLLWSAWWPVLIAFAGLCLLSSAGYIINDLHDAPEDRRNPEKRRRPIASGVVGPYAATIIFLVLLSVGTLALWSLTPWAALLGLVMLGFTTAYTILLRNEPVLDVCMLSVNFVIRAAVGAIVLNVMLSSWLILCAFFLALVLSVGKRLAEVRLLGDNAHAHRKSLVYYTPENSLLLMGVASSILLLSYALYSFIHGPQALLVTLPFAFFAVMRHAMLATAGSQTARHPHLLLRDWRMLGAVVIWGALTMAILYLL